MPDQTEPARIEIVSGTNQAGSVGTMLAEPLVVRVTDSRDRPVGDRQVVFEVLAGEGGSVTPDTALTDSDGRASVRWILGATEGTQRVQALVIGELDLATSFTASAGAGVAARVELIRGNDQTAIAGSTLPDSLVVRTLDEDGRPVAGISVTWTATGGGSVSAPATVTGPDGMSGIRRTLGPAAGPQGTQAAVQGASGSPIEFVATAAVGEAGNLRVAVQPAATAQSGLAFSRQPQIQLVDANGNTVARSGLAVSAELAAGPGGATLTGSATASTNDQGLAVFSNLGISGASGTYQLNFTGANVTGALSDNIIVSAGAATRLTIVTQPSASAKSGSRFDRQPVVRVVDAIGNPVGTSNVTVTAALASGTGTLQGTLSVMTDGTGTARFTDLAITGNGTHTIIFAASGLAGVVSGPVAVSGPPSASASTISAPATLAAGANGTVRVTLRSAEGTAIGGMSVTLAMSGEGNTISPASAITGASGEASFTIRSTVAGEHSVTATAEGVVIGPVEVAVVAGPPAADKTVATVPGGRRFRETVIIVETRDAFGNPVTTGGAAITAEVVDGPNQGAFMIVDDRGDGTYRVSYIPFNDSDDDDDADVIDIRLDDTPIAGSPFSSRVRD
ncbi:MAG TPA: Ig-like domain-containing protein [Gemmatimonadales bacterium]|nr:Ig-like domain-containing protein [Gemmatimonadales bacterium]